MNEAPQRPAEDHPLRFRRHRRRSERRSDVARTLPARRVATRHRPLAGREQEARRRRDLTCGVPGDRVRQMTATVDEQTAYVRSNAQLRPGFAELAAYCAEHGIRLAVASHGLDYYVQAARRARRRRGIAHGCGHTAPTPRRTSTRSRTSRAHGGRATASAWRWKHPQQRRARGLRGRRRLGRLPCCPRRPRCLLANRSRASAASEASRAGNCRTSFPCWNTLERTCRQSDDRPLRPRGDEADLV